jgi:hypothetical protein
MHRKTTVLSVAQLKLADFERGERAKAEANGRVVDGKATVGDLIAEYKFVWRPTITSRNGPRTTIRSASPSLLESWPELEKQDVRRVLPE